MKTIFALLVVVAGSAAGPEADVKKSDIEVTLMAVGDPSGGKLQANSTGCAVVHFLNRTKEPICFPTRPRGLGKGRVEKWDDASYLSPKQGSDYGWGYRAAYDIPKVRIEFVAEDGKVAHTDSSIQLQRIDVIDAGAWEFSPILFSTPPNSGVYSIRFYFDNTSLSRPSGHNGLDSEPSRLITTKVRVEIPTVSVIETKDAEQAAPSNGDKPPK